MLKHKPEYKSIEEIEHLSYEELKLVLFDSIMCKSLTKNYLDRLLQAGANLEDTQVYAAASKTPLVMAIIYGGFSITKMLINSKVSLDTRDINDKTPLHWAVMRNKLGVTKNLLALGVDIESKDIEGRTPLHYATTNRDIKIVKLLLDHGADINAVNKAKETSLHMVSMRKRIEVMQLLIDRGADVNALDIFNWTPLHVAVYANRRNDLIVKLLLAAGASKVQLNHSGQTAWDLAEPEIKKLVPELNPNA